MPDPLIDSFAEECATLGLRATFLTSDGAPPRLVFQPSGAASGPTLLGFFVAELAERGLDLGVFAPGSAPAATEDKALKVRSALRRTRARAVDLDAWNSSGFRFPFRDAPAGLRERGVALYRSPPRGAAVLSVDVAEIRVRCLPAEHGEIISSGFWLPTGVQGDYAVTLAYELREWTPGAREACVALFATRADGTSCHYAQHVTAKDRPSFVMASLDQRPSPPAAFVGSRAGEFRITRRGSSVRAEHAESTSTPRAWVELATHAEREVVDVLLGAKAWTHGRSGVLEVAFTDVRIEGQPCDPPGPFLPWCPDPRQEDT